MNTLKLVKKYVSMKNFLHRNEIDFFADRLSHAHTTTLILICISFTSLRYVKNTIDCWIPKELKRYENYMTKLCWLKGTYYLPIDVYGNVIDEKFYNESNEFKKEALITYYQWIIVIMLLQAFMFYIPYMIWSFVANRTYGFELTNIMMATAKYYTYDYPQERIINYLASFFKRYNHNFNFSKHKLKLHELTTVDIDTKKKALNYEIFVNNVLDDTDNKNAVKNFLKSFRVYLHLSYLFIKCLYLANALLQLYLINYFLTNSTYTFNAIDLFKQMINGTNMQETAIFPIIVQCDLNIGHDINHKEEKHFYSIRCVLSLNMFVEKIYVFLWIWCVIVAIFTFLDLIKWSLNFIITKFNYQFIKMRLKTNLKYDSDSKVNRYLISLFVNEYLSRDGVFILRLIEKNAGLLVTNDLILNLWNDFNQHMTTFLQKSMI